MIMSATKNLLHDYSTKLDDAWQQIEDAIIALDDLNDVVWRGDDETALEVPAADARLLKAKLQELEVKFRTFEGASRPGFKPFALPAFPSIRK